MSDKKSKRVSGEVLRNEHAATICSRGTTTVISPPASITSVTHSACSRCNAATNGDGAAASELGIGFGSLFSGSDAIRPRCSTLLRRTPSLVSRSDRVRPRLFQRLLERARTIGHRQRARRNCFPCFFLRHVAPIARAVLRHFIL